MKTQNDNGYTTRKHISVSAFTKHIELAVHGKKRIEEIRDKKENKSIEQK